jgi:exopolyphosphatase/pppGpp-phosphohydrolase
MEKWKKIWVVALSAYCLLLLPIISCDGYSHAQIPQKEAYVDIGSGSTKLVLLVYEKRAISPVIQIKRTPILFAKNLTAEKKFPKDLEEKGQQTLKEYAEFARKEGATLKGGGATSVFRKANATYVAGLLQTWSQSTGWKLKLLSAQEEAMSGYYAIGIIEPALKNSSLVAWDMGGGSVQLTTKREGKFTAHSLNWGAVPVSQFLGKTFATGRPTGLKAIESLKEEFWKDPQVKEWQNLPLGTKLVAIGGVAFGVSKLLNLRNTPLSEERLHKLEEELRTLSPAQVEEQYPSTKPYGAEMWPNTIAILTWMATLNIREWKVLEVEMGAGLGGLEFFK